MNKHLMPEEVEQWDWKLVSAATARAVKVMEVISHRYGPAGFRNYWPESRDEETSSSDDEPKFRPTRRDINQAEMVLLGYEDEKGRKHPGWLQGALLAYPEMRKTFSTWAKWAANGKRTFDGISETEEEFAHRIGMSESSLRRQREKAAGIIAMHLNQAEVRVWRVAKPRRRNKPRERSQTA